jgi:cell division transport system permease protein
MSLSYPVKLAIKSLYKEKWINILSVFTVAANLLIVTLIVFLLLNATYLSKNISDRFSMIVYFKDNLSDEEISNILNTLKNRRDTKSIKYISKTEAMDELRKVLKDSYLLEGLSENPLLPSAEIQFNKDIVTPETIKIISEEIKELKGVDSVSYGENIVETLYLLKKSIRNVSFIVFLFISTGVIFVIYSTVKILFYRKKEEIEIMKLLGATKGFIRKPFIIEGITIGLLGGILVTIGISSFYFALTYRLSVVIPMLKTLILPYEVVILPPLAGIVLGMTGAIIALGRLKL